VNQPLSDTESVSGGRWYFTEPEVIVKVCEDENTFDQESLLLPPV